MSLNEATPGCASILDNWIPTLRGARVRGGRLKVGIMATADNVDSMFVYKFGANHKMFAATATEIYDMTSPALPPLTTAAAVSGLTSGEWSVLQHTTTGGSFLCCFNGTDARRVFDGTTWATTPAITFPDATTTAQISAAFLFKQRQFLIKAGSMDAYYLGVNSIGGSASLLPLGGVLKQGGSLLTGFSWSLESGDGLNTLACFVSTLGEVAVYQGDDPSVAASWSLKGVYQIGIPLGKNAFIRAGADILICTSTGLIPISSVLQRDRDTLSLSAISRDIEEDWRRIATAIPYGWSITAWPEKNVVFVTFPFTSVAPDITYVLNIQTGKWSTISGWTARCYASLQGSLFFGDDNGQIWKGDATGADDGAPFKCVYLSHFLPVTDFGQRKTASLMTMYFTGKVDPIVKLFARADGDTSDPSGPEATVGGETASEWDVGMWDVALWDVGTDRLKIKRRQNVKATGDMIAGGCVITSGGSTPLQLEVDMGIIQLTTGEASA